MVGRGHTGVLQCLVEREPHVLGGHGSIQFLSVHEDHGSRFHSHRFPFTHRGAHSLLILSLETCLQLRNVEIMFLSLQAGEFIEFRILPVAATFTADGTLIGVQVIGIIPVGVVVLGKRVAQGCELCYIFSSRFELACVRLA